MKKHFQLALVFGAAGAVMLSFTSCSLMFGAAMLSPSVQSAMAAKAPIMTTAQAVKGRSALHGQIVHLYGKITQLGRHPRLDDSIDLTPNTNDTFSGARIGQMILVRGFFKSDRSHEMERLQLTSAVYYPGIEKAHEAELAKLRGEL